MAVATAVAADRRLAGGAAWPTYSRGSPAGPAKGRAGAVAGRRREGGARAVAQSRARGGPWRSGPATAGRRQRRGAPRPGGLAALGRAAVARMLA